MICLQHQYKTLVMKYTFSKLQATEQILQSPTVTHHTDGMSRGRSSNNLGQTVILSGGTVVSLGFTEIASEDSDTLLSTAINLSKELSEFTALSQVRKRMLFPSSFWEEDFHCPVALAVNLSCLDLSSLWEQLPADLFFHWF